MDSRNLNHSHAIRAENLSFASFCPVHGRIDSYVMGNMGRSAVCGGYRVSDAEPLALVGGGTLVDSVKIHCKAPSFDGWWLVWQYNKRYTFGVDYSERVSARCYALCGHARLYVYTLITSVCLARPYVPALPYLPGLSVYLLVYGVQVRAGSSVPPPSLYEKGNTSVIRLSMCYCNLFKGLALAGLLSLDCMTDYIAFVIRLQSPD